MSTVGDSALPALPIVPVLPTWAVSEQATPIRDTVMHSPRAFPWSRARSPARSPAYSSRGGYTPFSLQRLYATSMNAVSKEVNGTTSSVKGEPLNVEDSCLPSTRDTGNCRGAVPDSAECESDSKWESHSTSSWEGSDPDLHRRTDDSDVRPIRIHLRLNGRGEPQGDWLSARIVKELQPVVDKLVEDTMMWCKITPEVKYSIYRELQTKFVDGEKIAPLWILKKGKAIHYRTQGRKRRQLFREYCLTKNCLLAGL